MSLRRFFPLPDSVFWPLLAILTVSAVIAMATIGEGLRRDRLRAACEAKPGHVFNISKSGLRCLLRERMP